MVGSYYTLYDIQTVSSEIDRCKFLPASSIEVFDHILKNIVIPAAETFAQEIPNNRSFDTNKSDRNKRRGGRNKDRPSNEWDNIRGPAFKATKMETKEGIEKRINDFRTLLNKISTKNYEVQRDIIMENLDEIMTSENDSDLEKIAGAIFDIASANKFFSEVYADLYVELIKKHEIFRELISGLLENYSASLKNIHFVDHNFDYDGFCNYTKTNDLRKAMACFIINLMKKEAICKEHVINLMSNIVDLLKDYIACENRTNEVDEIIENLFIYFTQGKTILYNQVKWGEFLDFITGITKMKAKEQKSLSTRAIFKCMDILDQLKKPYH